jgi:hypothetical protein
MLEIIFACIAWRRGWKGKALLPLAASFLYGILLATLGVTDTAVSLLGDVIATIVLAVMAFCGEAPSA